MDFSEKMLYHQIHPAKLATDMTSSFISTYLLWRRRPLAALLAAFVPPIIASAVIIQYAKLEQQKRSRLGQYIRRFMNRRIEGWRFAGQLVMWTGAWYRVPWLIATGLGITVAAWISGMWHGNDKA